MRLLAIDYGTKKCGIAITDPLNIIAQPLTTIFYNHHDQLINGIIKIIHEYQPISKIILGITTNLDSSLSSTGKKTIKFKELLMEKIKNIEIILFDEKYTTKDSKEIMSQMQLSNKKKKALKDAIAAQKILINYMLISKI